jgi:hypothetical protein
MRKERRSRVDLSTTKVKQEELDNLTKPKEGELVDDNLEEVEQEEGEEEFKDKKKKEKEKDKDKTVKPVVMRSGEVVPDYKKFEEADDLLTKYSKQIEAQQEQVLEEEGEVDQDKVDAALDLEGLVVSDEQLVKEAAERQRKRQTYFQIESEKEWHKIAMFVRWDGKGNAVYKMKAYKFHDYPYEVRHVIDAIRGDYEDLYKAKQILDFARWFREPSFRNVSANYVAAQDKWIQVGSKFILHMKEKDLDLAHKDYILLIIDSFMYKQDTRLPNFRITSKPTSAANQSTSEDSAAQSGIQ